MAVFKNRTQGKYVIAGRRMVEDKRLRLIDRGLLITLLSLPETWNFSVRGLCSILPDGKSAINASMDRLIKFGYVKRSQLRKNGKYSDICIEVLDSPLTEKRFTENQFTEKQFTENRPQLNNNKFNTKQSNNKECNDSRKEDNGIGRNNTSPTRWSDEEKLLYGL